MSRVLFPVWHTEMRSLNGAYSVLSVLHITPLDVGLQFLVRGFSLLAPDGFVFLVDRQAS